MDLEKVEQVRRNIKYMYFPCYGFEFLHYLIVSKVMMCLHWFCFFWSFLIVLFLLANQSTDSGDSNQSGATKRFSVLCFPALGGAGYTFAVRSTLNSFGLVSGLFSFTDEPKDSFIFIHRQVLVYLFHYSTYLRKSVLKTIIQVVKGWSNLEVVSIIELLQTCTCIFRIEKS